MSTPRASASSYTNAMDTIRFTDGEKAELKHLLATARKTHEAHATAVTHADAAEPVPAWANSSESATAETSHRALSRRRAQTTARASRRLTATLAVAAALTLGAGGLAIAANSAGVSPTNLLAELFNATEQHEETTQHMGQSIGSSVTRDGITVTLDSVAGDEHNLLCAYTIERADGSPIEPGTSANSMEELDLDIFFNLGVTNTHGTLRRVEWRFYDADPADNAVQYLCIYTIPDEPIIGKTIQLTLERFYSQRHHTAYVEQLRSLLISENRGATAEEQAMAEAAVEQGTYAMGPWEFEFVANYENTTRQLPTGQAIPIDDMTATVTSLNVSPLGVTALFSITGTDKHPYVDHSDLAAFSALAVSVTLENGDVIVVRENVPFESRSSTTVSTSSGHPEKATARLYALTDQLIDPASVVAVTIGDLVIPAEPGAL